MFLDSKNCCVCGTQLILGINIPESRISSKYYICRPCYTKRQSEYRDPDYMKNWQADHIEERKEYASKRHRLLYDTDAEYVEKMKQRSKEHYIRNHDEVLAKNRKWRTDNYRRYWSMMTLRQHRHLGMIISIGTTKKETIDFVENLANNAEICKMCKHNLDWSIDKGSVRSNSPTLDRINNERILTRDNIQIICMRCNLTKQNRTMKEFVDYCRSIVELFGDEYN